VNVRKPVLRDKLRRFRNTLVSKGQSKPLIFASFNIIMGSVSALMTVVNIFTAKWMLMFATLIFALACLLNLFLFRRGGTCRKASMFLFLTEGICLCGFFCVSGTPEGFSALWTCFIPSFALTLMGRKRGSIYAGLTFLMVAFLFWTPPGRGLLQYQYTDSFMLRFPMIYAAFYAMALFLESTRFETQRHLLEAERRYQHLYKHDALTGIYNRYGFNERMDEVFSNPPAGEIAFMLLDLDLFKQINDTYGHDMGDVVLCSAAELICRLAGKEAVACRWGGEEFTVLMWDGRDPIELAERMRGEMERNVVHGDGAEIRVTVSIGVCIVSNPKAAAIAQVVKRADECLYEAKRGGRNQIVSARL